LLRRRPVTAGSLDDAQSSAVDPCSTIDAGSLDVAIGTAMQRIVPGFPEFAEATMQSSRSLRTIYR
jgi:hypothetical protein